MTTISDSRSLSLINRSPRLTSNDESNVSSLIATSKPACIPAAYSSPLLQHQPISPVKSSLPSAHLFVMLLLLLVIFSLTFQHLFVLDGIEIIIVSTNIIFVSSVQIIIYGVSDALERSHVELVSGRFSCACN